MVVSHSSTDTGGSCSISEYHTYEYDLCILFTIAFVVYPYPTVPSFPPQSPARLRPGELLQHVDFEFGIHILPTFQLSRCHLGRRPQRCRTRSEGVQPRFDEEQ
mmetsp:Transcript_21133/g.58799  ORF Transcript_21133/g.58799 Transcript_21133/m.58799 type:complete len:104 (+) Transcript_21133:628-939(+)